jgi:hypothetical protein
MMDDMSKRQGLITASFVILSAVSLLALAVFLTSQGLDRAAAWSNILALPVGIIGLAVGALAIRSPAGAHSNNSKLDREAAAPPIQIGLGHSQVNMVGGTVNIDNRTTAR